MPDFFKMPEKEIILLATEIAILLNDNLTTDQQNTLGNFIMTVGQNMVLGAGQKAIREQYYANNKDNKDDNPGDNKSNK